MSKKGLVQIATSDELCLQGYFTPKAGKSALLHIHGFEGNFYENKFVQVLASELDKENITFLMVNTRGSEKIKEFNTLNGGVKTIGARYELLEESPIDINAWIEFLEKEGYRDIVLMGHSLGTMKVVRYLSEGKYQDRIKKLILLSPFDKKAWLRSHTQIPLEVLLAKAEKMVRDGMGNEMVEDGFNVIDVSYKTWISWFKQDDMGRMFEFVTKNYESPILKKINIPTKVIVGSNDDYFHISNSHNSQEAMDILLKTILNSKGVLIAGGEHSFAPHEKTLSDEVIKFIK